MTDGAPGFSFASYVRDREAGAVGGTDEATRYAYQQGLVESPVYGDD